MDNGTNFKKFTNKECEYYPCHKGIEDINCLFCFCPLYALGAGCGGNFKILDNGVKDCSDCTLPHDKKNYDYICSKFNEIVELISRN